MRKPTYLLISLVIVALDQWSKWWIEKSLDAYEKVVIIPDHFQLVFAKNTGIAFGLFPSRGELLGTVVLALLGTVALLLVTSLFIRTPSHHSLLLVALALVLGGAIGNLTDRILLGAVTDFLDFFWGTKHFPTFNVADSAITVGIFFLAWDSLLGQQASPAGVSSDQTSEPSRDKPSSATV